MSREQLSEQQGQQAEQAHTHQQGDIRGLPPNLYKQAMQIGQGDVQALRDLLTLFPNFAPEILAVVSPNAGLSTVKRAQALVQQNAVGQGGSLSSEQIHDGGEFAVEGSAPTTKPPSSTLSQNAQEVRQTSLGEMDLSDSPDQARSDKQTTRQVAISGLDLTPSKPSTAPTAAPTTEPAAAQDGEPPRYEAAAQLLGGSEVAQARAFNTAHHDLVTTFNSLTDDLCCAWGPEGKGGLDPQKVASWQERRGLPADGKVGPRTVAAAKAAHKSNTEIVAAGQVDPMADSDMSL